MLIINYVLIISSIITVFASIFGLVSVLLRVAKTYTPYLCDIYYKKLFDIYMSSTSKNHLLTSLWKRKLGNDHIATIPQNYMSYKQLLKLVEQHEDVKEYFDEDQNNCLGIDNYE